MAYAYLKHVVNCDVRWNRIEAKQHTYTLDHMGLQQLVSIRNLRLSQQSKNYYKPSQDQRSLSFTTHMNEAHKALSKYGIEFGANKVTQVQDPIKPSPKDLQLPPNSP